MVSNPVLKHAVAIASRFPVLLPLKNSTSQKINSIPVNMSGTPATIVALLTCCMQSMGLMLQVMVIGSPSFPG